MALPSLPPFPLVNPIEAVAGSLPYGEAALPGPTLRSSHLHRIPLSQARRGDLMFYGSGHVEIDTTWYHQTFGAHDYGQRVGWAKWGPWFYPTAAYRVY